MLNRPNRTTDPYNGSTKTSFDALDQILQITDPRNLTTQYGMNNLGDQLSLRSPDTGNRSAKYDTGGNMIQKIDGRGITENRKYDALNRLTRVDWFGVSRSATPVVSSQYIYDQGVNGTGHLTGIIDESGHTEFAYDLRGRMLNKVQTVLTGSEQKSFSMSQTFGKSGSATGHMTSLTYPSGNRLAFTYDAVGRVRSVTLESNNESNSQRTTLLSDISYNHFTDVNGWTWGNGSKWYRQYDLNGRVTCCESVDQLPMTSQTVEDAAYQLAAEFRGWLTVEHYGLLAECDLNPNMGQGDVINQLIEQGVLLEYNTGAWRQAHPVLHKLKPFLAALELRRQQGAPAHG
jgi:YD repeat-containing protein